MEEVNFEDKIVSKINEAREFLGMNREEFGQLFGMVKSSVSKLENGKHKMFVQKLIDIANAIKVDLSYFFNNQPYPEAVIAYLDNILDRNCEDTENRVLNHENARYLLGDLKDNPNLNNFLNETVPNFIMLESHGGKIVNKQKYTRKKISYLMDQLTIEESEDLYSLIMWFMRSKGYNSSHLIAEGFYGVDKEDLKD